MQVYPNDPDDEMTGSEAMILWSEVEARLKVLRPFHVEDTRVPATAMQDPTVEECVSREDGVAYIEGQPEDIRQHLEVVEYGDESDELEALRGLRDDMLQHMGGEGDWATAVHEGHLNDHVRNELEGIYGEEAIGATACHTDWDAVSAEHAIDMTSTRFRGSDYYITR